MCRADKDFFLSRILCRRPQSISEKRSEFVRRPFGCCLAIAMDARALLTSQGWRGDGHSLYATSNDIGLRRPLLVSQKQNVLGIGKKQHSTSDQWWMNAFDKSLKGLDTSKEGVVVQTVSNGGLDMVIKGGGKYVGSGGLYASFVKGETLVGDTILAPATVEPAALDTKRKRKKEATSETKEERRSRKAAKKARTAAKANTVDSSIKAPKTETKEERKERRRRRKLLKLAEAEPSKTE